MKTKGLAERCFVAAWGLPSGKPMTKLAKIVLVHGLGFVLKFVEPRHAMPGAVEPRCGTFNNKAREAQGGPEKPREA